jgi:hypothetical protein
LSIGTFYGNLVYFIAIWYIFSLFGILYQEKFGNPGWNLCISKNINLGMYVLEGLGKENVGRMAI